MKKLYYSERKLWDECEQARPVVERLARAREVEQRIIALCESSTTGMVAIPVLLAAVYGTGSFRPKDTP